MIVVVKCSFQIPQLLAYSVQPLPALSQQVLQVNIHYFRYIFLFSCKTYTKIIFIIYYVSILTMQILFVATSGYSTFSNKSNGIEYIIYIYCNSEGAFFFKKCFDI